MKFSELLVEENKFEYYDYDDNIIKLFKADIPKNQVYLEFEKTKLINTFIKKSSKVYEVVEVEDQLGIVFKRYKGETMLYQLESDYNLLDSLAIKFANIHKKLLVNCPEVLIEQNDYFKKMVLESTLKKELKEKYYKLIDNLPSGNVFCHGNFHLNQVLVHKDDHKILDFLRSFKGHPLADIAIASVVIQIPSEPKGISSELSESLKFMRERFFEHYIEIMGVEDEELFYQFYKLGAISRLNEKREGEQEWLMTIIEDA